MSARTGYIAFAGTVMLVVLGCAASARAASFPDSLGAWTPTRGGSMFDTVTRADYLRAHAFSLDEFLQFAPGGVVVRATRPCRAVRTGRTPSPGWCATIRN
jgi:hypothetical protein